MSAPEKGFDAFREHLSEHGDVGLAAFVADVSKRHGYRLLKRMKDELGWQAK